MQPDIPRELRYSLISIAREALVNIARHSHATQAAITAIEHPGFYQFIIEDNGIGGKVPPIADINTPHTSSGGIGLSNIYTALPHGTVICKVRMNTVIGYILPS